MSVKLDRLVLKHGYKNYLDYLRSNKWRKFCKSNKSKKCFVCRKRKDLCLHHIRYNNICNEEPADVVTVCEECHSKIHILVDGGEKLEEAHFILQDRKSLGGLKEFKEIEDGVYLFTEMEDAGLINAYDKSPTVKSLDEGIAIDKFKTYLWDIKKVKLFLEKYRLQNPPPVPKEDEEY